MDVLANDNRFLPIGGESCSGIGKVPADGPSAATSTLKASSRAARLSASSNSRRMAIRLDPLPPLPS